MSSTARLALLGAALVLATSGCASSSGNADLDAGGDDALQADRPQQDAPSFFPDSGGDDDAAADGGELLDGATADAGAQLDGSAPCYPEPDEALGGDDCAGALDRGSLSFAATSHLAIVGNLWPGGDVDWYRVTFADTGTAADCGKFKARIAFAQNPGDHFRFEVSLDDCTGLATCGTGAQASGLTTYSFDGLPGCPCAVYTADPSPTADGVFLCKDLSLTLRIRVFRAPGSSPACENYELSVDNG